MHAPCPSPPSLFLQEKYALTYLPPPQYRTVTPVLFRFKDLMLGTTEAPLPSERKKVYEPSHQPTVIRQDLFPQLCCLCSWRTNATVTEVLKPCLVRLQLAFSYQVLIKNCSMCIIHSPDEAVLPCNVQKPLETSRKYWKISLPCKTNKQGNNDCINCSI